MEIKNIETGYPHRDKPWMKYYSSEMQAQKMPKKTLYENMRDNVAHNLSDPAVTYNGEQICYEEFLDYVKTAAKVLTAVDVQSGDRILYLMANIPETSYTLYGTNLIGGVADYADPRPDSVDFKISAKKILEIIKREKIKHIVALDQCYLAMIKPIEEEIKECGINNVILVSATDSMTKRGTFNYIDEYLKFNGVSATIKKLKYLKVIAEKLDAAIKTSVLDIISYKDMVKNVSTVNIKPVTYTPNAMAAITHSSGTSGTFPKAIPLTNEGIMSYAFQLNRSNTYTQAKDSNLQILPYFSAYGLGIGNFGFSNAYNMIQIPEFVPKNMGKLIKKYRPNAIMGTPNWYLTLTNDKSLKNVDLSFIHTIGYGGDSMNPEDEAMINDFLAHHNCSEKITKGHGMSELSGGASYAIGDYNILGSMGIPMIDTIYGVVDPETKELVKFEKDQDRIEGEFIISSPAIVSETLDGNPVIKHGTYDGIDFIYSGDIGTMDRNGVLYFLTRSDRAFTRYDGFKVKPFQIENNIKALPEIKDCYITPYFDDEHKGNMIQANLLLKEDMDLTAIDQLVNDMIDDVFIKNYHASSRQIPTRIVIKKDYPVTLNGKVNYAHGFDTISDDDLVYRVTFDETTISVDNIRIKRVTDRKVLKKI